MSSLKKSLVDWPLDKIETNPWQPRTVFNAEEMSDLAASLKSHTQLQPGIARPKPSDPSIAQLMDGERRFRGLSLNKARTMTLVIGDFTDQEMAEAAIVSNRDRVANNPLELARAYKRLQDEFGLTAEAIAQRAGKSRPVISNLMRLLELPPEVQAMISENKLSEAHGRALAGYNDFPDVARAFAIWAVQHEWPSKALEKWPYLDYQQLNVLLESTLVVRLPYTRDRVFEMCSKCPFKAFRQSEKGNAYCLKPNHYEELKKAYDEQIQAERKTPQETAIEQQKRDQEYRQRREVEQAKREATRQRNMLFATSARARLDETRQLSIFNNTLGLFTDEIRLIFVSIFGRGNYDPAMMTKAVERWNLDLDMKALRDSNYGEARNDLLLVAVEQLRVEDLLLLLAETLIEVDTQADYREAVYTPDYQRAGEADTEIPTL